MSELEQDVPPTAVPAQPFSELQLADREALRILLRPKMNQSTFNNWVSREIKQHGFPEPIRLGARSCAWSLLEVKAWLASRPRKGVFHGRRAHAGAAA